LGFFISLPFSSPPMHPSLCFASHFFLFFFFLNYFSLSFQCGPFPPLAEFSPHSIFSGGLLKTRCRVSFRSLHCAAVFCFEYNLTVDFPSTSVSHDAAGSFCRYFFRIGGAAFPFLEEACLSPSPFLGLWASP